MHKESRLAFVNQGTWLRRGVYGLVPTTTLDIPEDWQCAAPHEWLDWSFESRVEHDPDRLAAASEYEIGPDHARLPLQPTGFVEVDRVSRRTTLVLDHALTAGELMHPGMASTAALAARWNGRLAVHGAAVTPPSAGSAIAFLGDREHGKSSSVAWLQQRGWAAIADDVLVIDGVDVLAGPRMVDLRQQTADTWGMGSFVGTLGQRERWRLYGGEVAPSTPISAVVVLTWGDEVRLRRLNIDDRLKAFVDTNILRVPPTDQRALLAFLGIPTFELARPKDLTTMDVALVRLLGELGLGEEGTL